MRKKDLSMTRKYRKEKNERNRSKRNRNRDTELSLRQKEFEHRPPYTLTPHIYTNIESQSHRSNKIHDVHSHSSALPKLSTHDGKTEWNSYIIQFNHIPKK